MSSTRHASADSPLRQERYASSPEFERGLLASRVAQRCSVLDGPQDRELIWHLHFRSHQPGGLEAVAADLVAKFGERVETSAMARIGKRAGQQYSAEQVREIRKDLPRHLRGSFLLKGEAKQWNGIIVDARTLTTYEESMTGEDDHLKAASALPENLAVSDFISLCHTAAAEGLQINCTDRTASLAEQLRQLCLDPAFSLETSAPWYFPTLVPTLRDYTAQWIAQAPRGVVITALGQLVHDTLDYTRHSKSMTLLEGDARTGKSFSARTWCEQHPGQARFVEVPTGNDQKDFFRAIARGLGLGNFQQYKAAEIRERVEGVLLTGDLLLCLDEAHRLWPQMNLRYGFPKRIEWLMSMANQGVPICLVATPQFLAHQKAVEQTGWNSAQFIGRLGDYKRLPRELELDDLIAVAKSVLPEADKQTLRALAAYARTSARYLAAIDAIAKRARYLAVRAGRKEATTGDVRTAMKESVIPSDSNLVCALEGTAKPSRQRKPLPLPSDVSPAEEFPQSLPPRAMVPATTPRNRISDLVQQEA